jgi:hypothetical protein
LGSQRAEGRSTHQKRNFTQEIALFEFLLRKLGLLSVNIQNNSQTALQEYVEPGGRALPKEPFSRLKPQIGDNMRQASAFDFVKTGKDFGLPQLFWSKHETRLKTGIDNRELLYYRMLSRTPTPKNADALALHDFRTGESR